MNSITKTDSEDLTESKSQLLSSIKKYVLLPVKAGLYGFTLVFSVLVLLKLLSHLFGISEVLNLDLMDVMLSSVGFFFMFLLYILKNSH
jgi:hypothetical protein